jgi:hypothetical protein
LKLSLLLKPSLLGTCPSLGTSPSLGTFPSLGSPPLLLDPLSELITSGEYGASESDVRRLRLLAAELDIAVSIKVNSAIRWSTLILRLGS